MTSALPTEAGPQAGTGRVTVRVGILDLAAGETEVVLSAALQLFGPQDAVDVVLWIAEVDEVTEEHGLAVQELCLRLAPDPARLPEILLLGATEAAALTAHADVTTGRDAAESARAVVLLGAAAQEVWDGPADRTPTASTTASASVPGSNPWPQITRLEEELAVARRDVRSARAIATGRRRPRVVLVFQHRSYWGAVATLWTALAARPEVDTEVVALDSTADGRHESTSAFLAERGITARDADWFLDHLDDIDVVVLDNPYDEFRPLGLQVEQLVDAGIRVVAVPYGTNAMGGALMDALLWDLPLQRSAWRAYVGSETQRALFARHCAAGAAHVRVLGTPKMDRVQQPVASEQVRRWRAAADGRPLVLWNPHFRVEPGGWSTFDSYVGPLFERFADDDSAVLLVRPHFRLFPGLRAMGPEGVKLERDVRSIAARTRTIVLDESPDYLDALTACDAMLSDMSSLVTELLPTGKPILHLRRADGPGLNEDGSAQFGALETADSWTDVAGFLDRLVAGEDRHAEQRAALVREGFALADGRAGERIAGDIVTTLLEELGERAPSLGPALNPALVQKRYDAARTDRLEHAVVLSAYSGSVACNPRAIAHELHRVGHDALRWWVVNDPRQAVPPGCQPLLKDSADYAERVSRARWLVDNEAMPWFLDKRPGQTFLQTWHGTPLKLLRWHLHEAVPRSPEYMEWADKEAGQWDVLVSASPLFTEIAADAFHTPARVIETGYPRNDVLADPARRETTAAAVRRVLSVPAGARVVLHAPTFRDPVPGPSGPLVSPRVTDAAALAEALGPDVVVLQRVHRFAAELTGARHPQVREVSEYPDSADLMALADVLVTDYSSSMFDYTATGRPIVLHVPDYEDYRDRLRGFYFPLDEVAPGPLTRTDEDLAVAVKERLLKGTPADAGYVAFRERFAPWEDGNAAARVVAEVFG